MPVQVEGLKKITSISFQEVKVNNFTNNLTEQKDIKNKDRSEHSANKILKEQKQQQQQQ